jgi:hypothetical protein
MKNLTLLLLSLLFILSLSNISNVDAQTIEKIGANKFEYEGKVYKYSDMDKVFNQSAVANSYYLLSKKQLKNGKTWGYTSLGSLAFGFLLVAVSPDAEGFLEISTGQAIGGVFAVIVFPVTGLIGLINHANAKQNQKRSVETFNQEYGIELPKKNPVELNIASISNGVGLQLKF